MVWVAHGGDVWDKPLGVIDFSSNINPLGPPPSVLEALRANLHLVERYPDPKHSGLRLRLAPFLGVSAEEVLVGCGSTELIYLAGELCAALRGAPPRALIAAPTFGEYEAAVRRIGGVAEFVFAERGDLKFDPQKIVEHIPREGIVYLCNPNNPTGQTLSGGLVGEIVEEASRRGALMVVDEGFVEFTADPEKNSVVALVESYDNLVVLRSPAKLFAIPGLRVGYGAASQRLAAKMRVLQQPWSVGVLAEAALLAALGENGFVERSRRYVFYERERFVRALDGLGGLFVYPSDTNFFLVDTRRTGLSGPELKSKLLERGFLIRDCSDFRGLDEYHVRLAVRRGEENVGLVDALRQVLAESFG